jgi:hypothetical protein
MHAKPCVTSCRLKVAHFKGLEKENAEIKIIHCCFHVLVVLKISFFWVMPLFRLVCKPPHFRETCHLHLLGVTLVLKKEIVRFFETGVYL